MIRERTTGSRATLGLQRRLIGGFAVLIVLYVLADLLVVGTLMRDRMRQGVDTELRRHAVVLQAALQQEEKDLGDDATMAANLHGMEEALSSRNTAELKRLLIPIIVSKELTCAYVVYEDRSVALLIGDPMTNERRLASSRIVERGFDFLSTTAMLEYDGTLWAGASSAHRGTNGRPEALIVVGKRLDSDYVQSLSDLTGFPVAFSWGNGIAYSLNPAPAELSPAQLHAFRTKQAEYRNGAFAFGQMNIGNLPYRMLGFNFSSRNGRPLVGYLFQPMTPFDDSLRMAFAGVVGVGAVLALLGMALASLYIRSVARPLARLEQAAQAIAQGKLDEPVRADADGVLGQLPHVFEDMRVRLQDMMRRQKEWNRDLEIEVQAKTEELSRMHQSRAQLLRQTITAQEEERRRIARELHDETSQALTGLQIHLATAEMDLTGETKEWIAEAKRRTVGILREINRLVLDLRPTLLDDYGLGSALSWYASSRFENSGTNVQVAGDSRDARLSPTAETALFRVGQEAISNAAQHAGAKNLCVSLTVEEKDQEPMATLVIEDDGCGFDAKAEPRSHGGRPRLGLLGMQERVQLVGGSLEIRSAPGQGTQVIARVPLSTAVEEKANL
ncbi:MAG: histidine kinase [Chloroflexi bacterium]|nr:histidine kinase [Chloroflexota bacterium]